MAKFESKVLEWGFPKFHLLQMTSIKIQRQKLWCLQTENYWFTSYKLQVYVVKIFKICFFLSWVSSAWVSITASQKLQSSSLLECCNSLFKVSPAMIRRFVPPILHIHEELGLSRQYAVFFVTPRARLIWLDIVMISQTMLNGNEKPLAEYLKLVSL